MVCYVVTNNGSFNEEEANEIVDAYMISRARDDPTLHPLQTVLTVVTRYKSTGSGHVTAIFSNSAFKKALASRGFHLNLGPFSKAESMTLMKNFERFLAQHNKATDRESIWNLLNNQFADFYAVVHSRCCSLTSEKISIDAPPKCIVVFSPSITHLRLVNGMQRWTRAFCSMCPFLPPMVQLNVEYSRILESRSTDTTET